MPLPEILTTYYRSFGRSSFNRVFNRLLGPADITQSGEMVVFCEENQQVVKWAIRTTQPIKCDPAVFQSSAEDHRWYAEHAHLSSFLVGFLGWQLVNGGLPVSGEAEICPGQFRALTQQATAVRGLSRDERYDVRVLYVDGSVFCVIGRGVRKQLFFGARSGSRLRKRLDQIGVRPRVVRD